MLNTSTSSPQHVINQTEALVGISQRAEKMQRYRAGDY